MGADCSSCSSFTDEPDNKNRPEKKESPKDTPANTSNSVANRDSGKKQKPKKINTDTNSIYDKSDPQFLIKEWKNAVEQGNNSKIKKLFTKHYKHLNFLRLKWDNGDNTLHRACALNNIKLVTFLLLVKLNINEINEINGNTGCHYAAMNGNERIIKLLVNVHTVDLQIRNNDGDTALDIAQSPKTANLKVEKLLLEGLASHVHSLGAPQRSLHGHIDDHFHMTGMIGGDSGSIAAISGDTINNINNIGGISISYSRKTSAANSPRVDGGSPNTIAGDSISMHSINEDSSQNLQGGGLSMMPEITPPPPHIDGSEIEYSQWLEKKKSKFPHGWEKFYVIICGHYILWSHKIIDMSDKELGSIVFLFVCLFCFLAGSGMFFVCC